MTVVNRARGRAAKAAGDAWEAFVDTQHEMAKYLGVLVHVAHAQPATKFVGGRLIHVAKSGTDYVGTLSDGRTFCAEAKSVKGDTRLMHSEVRPKQAEQLDLVAKAGGLAYLLVEFRGVGGTALHGRFAIPWLEVPWTRLRSAESISFSAMSLRWAILPGECYLKPGVQVPVGAGGRRRVFPRD